MEDWNKAYQAVEQNPDDFEKWQDLVESVEAIDGGLNKTSSSANIELFRYTFDRILGKWPMLQGFWVRYAQWEFKIGFNDKACEVYERGVSLMPGCVDLWVRYCRFVALVSHDPDTVRRVFQRGATTIGNHFLSHEFWDAYINFEEQYGTVKSVFDVLDRVIRVPLHQYARFFERFRKQTRLLPAEQTVDEFKLTQFRAEYELEKENRLVNQNISQDYDLRVRANYYHEEVYERTKWAVAKRVPYETQILRHHFDILYLEESQLVCWRNYLQFERVEGEEEAGLAELLFERAVIPLALHEEIWLSYTRFLLSNNHKEQARVVLTRACQILPITRLKARHFLGRWLESEGEFDQAQQIYQSILAQTAESPLETVVLLGGVLLRHEGLDRAVEHYTTHIAEAVGEDLGFLISECAKLLSTHTSIQAGSDFFAQYESKHSSFIYWREYLKFEMRHRRDEQVKRVFAQIQQSEMHYRQIKDLGHYYMEYTLTNLNAPHEFIRVDAAIHKGAALTL